MDLFSPFRLSTLVMKDIVIGGIYRHYKGHVYKVVGLAKHSECLDKLVIYQRVDRSEKYLWARPKDMFLEKVVVEGKRVTRFALEPKIKKALAQL